jgi:photosystem II stability/assembly factor-like uncharacterized protein
VFAIRRWCAILIALALASLPATVPAAHAADCRFVLGFAALEQMIPQQVGLCLDDEQHNPANGDGLQHTTGGLLVWRKADNWTAFTDGYRTWINGPHGLEERLNTQRFPWEANPDGLPVVLDNPVGQDVTPLPAADLRTILFADSRHGWAAGSQRIVATTDGGTTWTTQFSGPAVIEQLDVLNANDGWALGQHELLHTVDGGQHWVPVAEPPQPLNQIHFLNLATGYGVAGGTLYQTSDAGVTWRPLTTPIAAGGLCFVSKDTGWIVNTSLFLGRGPAPDLAPTALYGTTDGGATWRQVALPAAVTRFTGLGQRLQCAPPGVLWDLFVGEPGAGNEFYALYRGPNGGASWQLITGHELPQGGAGPEPGPYAGALSVVSADAAYLTGWCGACYPSSPTTPPAVAIGGTTDAGRTWRDFPVPGLPPTATDIAFVTDDQGWLVAEGNPMRPSQILATSDGGRTWTTQLTLGSTPRQ